MIQPIYTSVSNADIVPCGKKGLVIKSDPIPLLRNNYLGEYRTELEKAKVRKNLGIADEQSLQWGNVKGFIEEQLDLVNYVESKWRYTSELSKDISNVSEALDYILYFIATYKDNNEVIAKLGEDIQLLQQNLAETKQELLSSILGNSTAIETILQNILTINQSITLLNLDLKSINVDANILKWMLNSVKDSKTVSLLGNTLELSISSKEGNAILIDEGIYVKDYSEDVAKISTLELNIKANSEAIEKSITQIEESDEYQTDLSDDTEAPTTLGGIIKGTKVSYLKGKTVSEILDIMLFPTTVRPLVLPSLYYSSIPNLVLVGSELVTPQLNFTKGDSGGESERVETIVDPQNNETDSTTYNLLGKYTFKATVYYNEGEPLVDNKGEVTNIKVEAGSLTASLVVETTYPWYISEVGKSDIIQTLVPFGISKELLVSLSGRAVVKLPGKNTSLESFMADAGLGFLTVDLDGWEETTELINNIDYRVWTKKDNYSSPTPHKIKFKLAL